MFSLDQLYKKITYFAAVAMYNLAREVSERRQKISPMNIIVAGRPSVLQKSSIRMSSVNSLTILLY